MKPNKTKKQNEITAKLSSKDKSDDGMKSSIHLGGLQAERRGSGGLLRFCALGELCTSVLVSPCCTASFSVLLCGNW